MRKARIEKLTSGLYKCLVCGKDDLKSVQAAGGHYSKLHRKNKIGRPRKTPKDGRRKKHQTDGHNVNVRIVTIHFCSTCGARIPNAIVIEGKKPTPIEVTIHYCPSCGNKIPNAIIKAEV